MFMGTPEFAVPCLEMLVRDGYNVSAVVTQPDKQRGRGNKVSYCEVKECALSHNIGVLQPDKVKNNLEFIEKVKEIAPDVIVTCAYGKILPKTVLDIPRFGCINVHASLLPRYRGASPINKAIIDGEKETGVTTMYTDIGMDTGDILLARSVPIDDNMTAGELHDVLSRLGADVLKDTLVKLKNNELVRIPQDESKCSYAGMMDKYTGRIDWKCRSWVIHNLVRGTNPWPGAYTYYKDTKLKIWETTVVDVKKDLDAPGKIISVSKEGIDVATQDGIVRILKLQAPSKKKMPVSEYILGNIIEEGEIFWQGN